MLPHRYPFRFLDQPGEGVVHIQITEGGRYSQCAGRAGIWLALEAMAQACVLLPRGSRAEDECHEGAYLVGVDRAEIFGFLEVGDRLTAHARVVARLGRMVRVEARLLEGDELKAEAELSFALEV